MAIGLWNLSTIKTKIRNITGRISTDQLSDDDLVNYINRYYQLVFPLEVRPAELKGWFQFDTVDGTDEYDLTSQTDSVTGNIFEDEVVSIEFPVTIDGYDIDYYLNPIEFYSIWPESSTYTDAQPSDVLYYDETLIFRPTPDDAYTFKIAAWKRPTAFANSSPTSEYPILEDWGPIIAYGTAKEIFEDDGDVESIMKIEENYQTQKDRIMRRVHYQNANSRAYPTF